jgi:hypothetical protein
VTHRSLAGGLCLALLLVARALPVGAQAIAVYVDGRSVTFDQPPIITGGRVLVPVRGVFQRLGARVDWQAERRTVVARRGATVVVLRPDNAIGEVDGRLVRLDVPATIVAGRVLVPLRFVSQALGASVVWEPSARIVYVVSPGAVARRPGHPVPDRPILPPPASPAPIITPVPAPAQPVLTAVEGTVHRVDTLIAPPQLYVRVDSTVLAFSVGPDAAIFVSDVATGRGGAASLGQIQRGDHVRLTLSPLGHVLAIRASYRELAGRLDGLGARTLFLADGQGFRLADEVLIVVDGREATRDLLHQGMEVVLRLNPVTNEVWMVRARSPVPPPRLPRIIPVSPTIDSVALNAPRLLGIGDTLVVSMRGTPGGEAWFDIARVERGVRMVEDRPGRYTGRYTIRAGEAAASGTVTVRLRIAGVEIARVADTVMVDGLPPEFVRVVPEPDSVVRSSAPAISVWFTDRGPSGISADRARLWVNGIEARRVSLSETSAAFAVAEPLAPGRSRAQARIVDRAGNEATTSWVFFVNLSAPSPPPVPTPTPTVPPPKLPVIVTPPPVIAPPVIVSPKAGDAIRPEITIKGTVSPGHRVLVRVEIQWAGVAAPRVLGPISVTPSSSGGWELRIEVPGAQAAVRVTLSAVAVSPSGARSEPARVTLLPGPPGQR